MRVAIGRNTREATAHVVSEDEDLMAPIEALDHLEGSFSKGSSFPTLFRFKNKPKKLKTSSSMFNVLSPKIQAQERLCCIFPGSMMEIKPVIDKIFKAEIATLVESSKMKKVFHDIKMCAKVKNKKV